MTDSEQQHKKNDSSDLSGVAFSYPQNSESSINSDCADVIDADYIRSTDVVYIAGPMTGKPLFNYPAFYGFAGLIEKEFGCRVLNPARQPNGLTYYEYIRRALADVEAATVILFLEGWRQSPGARLEFQAAYKFGLEIIYENQLAKVIERRFAHHG